MYHIVFYMSTDLADQETKGQICTMNKKQENNLFVKECITEALLQLMNEKTMSQISVTELVERAGVARVSFYRNFTSKENVIEQHLVLLIKEWGREFEKKGDPSLFAQTLRDHFYAHKCFYLLLYKQNLSQMIYENIRGACGLNEAKSNMERYIKSMFAGTIFGWLDEWARQGMPETPDELALLTNEQRT